jgi:hypothetical protein
MSCRKYSSIVLLATLLILFLATSASAVTTYTVMIDTAALNGSAGKLVFDFTSNNGFSNHVDILNFTTDGTLGLPETEGGLVEGDIILGSNPAHHTRIHDAFFFNELMVNFVSFGNQITFTLEISESPSSAGQLPDEFALFLLDSSFHPLFKTSDPLGANALFSVCVTGAPGGLLSVFDPTILQPPSTLKIVVPALNAPPDCSQAKPSVAILWPPNHKMIEVSILGVTDPDGDPITIKIDSVKQDEPNNGLGDGDTCPDALGIGNSTAKLRAERSGTGNGRVYTIFFTATDGRGGSCSGSVKVCIPRDNSTSCVDDGSNVDSAVCSPVLAQWIKRQANNENRPAMH